MRLLLEIDLSAADLSRFEAYEAAVLPLVAKHGGKVECRVRTIGAAPREVHILYFPDSAALEAYLADPARAALAPDWQACGALAKSVEVEAI